MGKLECKSGTSSKIKLIVLVGNISLHEMCCITSKARYAYIEGQIFEYGCMDE